jgi:hypothetical protein
MCRTGLSGLFMWIESTIGLERLNVTMWLDGANGEVNDSSESQPRYGGQTGLARPLGYEV